MPRTVETCHTLQEPREVSRMRRGIPVGRVCFDRSQVYMIHVTGYINASLDFEFSLAAFQLFL